MIDSAPTIGVLLPTRNSAALLPAHLESMRPWLDLAAEVVVVDSESKDGTMEMLRAKLAHPNVKFLAHPPGLYQSWNFGIQNIRAKYIYISTVGDSITRPGLEHLRAVAEAHESDVVISKPRYINEAGAALPDEHWPIDDILSRLTFAESTALTVGQQFIFALTNTWGAILGSSASDLYRTAALRPRPFPTEFGTAGDGGWGIQNMFDVKIAVTRGRFSLFRFHEKTYSLADYRVDSLTLKFFRLAQKLTRARQAADPRIAALLAELRWPELEPAMEISFAEQDRLVSYRLKKLPWYCHPGAWQARARRNRAERAIRAIKDEILARGSS